MGMWVCWICFVVFLRHQGIYKVAKVQVGLRCFITLSNSRLVLLYSSLLYFPLPYFLFLSSILPSWLVFGLKTATYLFLNILFVDLVHVGGNGRWNFERGLLERWKDGWVDGLGEERRWGERAKGGLCCVVLL